MDKEEKREENEFEKAAFEEWRGSRFTMKLEAQLREDATASKRTLYDLAIRSSDSAVAGAAVMLGATERMLGMLRGEKA